MAKIVLIGSYAPSLINFRGHLLCEMVKHGHNVTACAPDAKPEILRALSSIGVEYWNIPISRTGLNPIKDLNTLYRLYAMFRRLKPEVSLAYTIKPVVYSSLAAYLAKVPQIYSIITGLGHTFSNSRIEGLGSAWLTIMVRVLYRSTNKLNQKIFFQNPDDMKLFAEYNLLKDRYQSILVNGSGVDLNHYDPAAFPNKPSFLLIARLLKEKGIREYAQAASIIKQRYPKVSFQLVGRLEDHPSSISKNELSKWEKNEILQYHGQLPDVRPAIKSASVYVLPSYYREGVPRTILEAMAMGRPIITTDAPGCRETVTNGRNGFLVSTKSIDELVSAMVKFIKAPDLIFQMGSESRKIAIEKFDVKKVNNVILKSMGLIHHAQEVDDGHYKRGHLSGVK